MSRLHIRPPEPARRAIRDLVRGALDALVFLALGAAICAALIHILFGGWR